MDAWDGTVRGARHDRSTIAGLVMATILSAIVVLFAGSNTAPADSDTSTILLAAACGIAAITLTLLVKATSRPARRNPLVRDLRAAMESGQLSLFYQPKAQVKTGRTRHVEALIRWEHPTRGFVPPEEVIAIAESAHFLHELSVWVLETAIHQSHVWRRSGIDVHVAVNISPRSLLHPDLVEKARTLLHRWDVPAGNLNLEITEGALIVDPAVALGTLTALRDMGVSISIDDFGKGYSSLSYLTRLPADQIKIDKSFVLDMVHNSDNAFIVRSVIDLGHNLSLEVVAEGVENQATWDLLAGMGCDIIQGFHLSRPMPAPDVGRWLEREARVASCAS